MIKIIKRDGTKESFDKVKVMNAIYKSTINSKYGIDEDLAKKIGDSIESIAKEGNIELTVENI